jgi:hypothetical protein
MQRQNSRLKQILPALVALAAAVLACNMPVGPRVSPGDATITAAIKTVHVRLSETAASRSTTNPSAVAPSAPAVVLPSGTTVTPTQTPVPPTAVTRCNWAEFISDVTIPDGTRLPPGAPFTKTWRLKNIGTCTWTADYSAVFDNGTSMNAPASVPMPQTVPPGGTVDISVNLVAPLTPGKQVGNWRLRNPAGIDFGLGYDAQRTFYVQIDVTSSTPTPTVTTTTGPNTTAYDFVEALCQAEWRSGSGRLPCPGTDSDTSGFVLRVDGPTLQDAQERQGSGIWIVPQMVDNGAISGRFPAFKVQAGDHFQAMLGCLYGATTCNQRFQLNYRADGGALQNFGQWDMTYSSKVQVLNLDLTPLAGKNVEFVLAAIANGSPNQDWAVWFQPHITR